uniref:Uncharacterized protein n=1 Tax=viral metagenome TaxID=1070528 RepID=A0A6C0C8R1_9ZZZZ
MHLDKALCEVVQTNQVHLTKALVNAGASFNYRDKYGHDALYYACKYGDLTQIKWLCENGADVNRRYDNDVGLMTLEFDRKRKVTVEIMDILWYYDGRFCGRKLILHTNDCVHILKWMMNVKYVYIDGVDKDGKTLLHLACITDQIGMVKFLIENEIDVDARCNKGLTALSYAVISNNITAITLLLECDANINNQDDEGNTALHFACARNNLKAACLLSRYQADDTVKNDSGVLAYNMGPFDVSYFS